MPKILFVALHRPDRSPSQRFRYEQYIDFLTSNGWECECSYLIPEEWDRSFYAKGHYLVKLRVLMSSVFRRFRDMRKAGSFDVIFIQREAFMLGSVFFEKQFCRSGAKVVFDFDDAIWLENVSQGNKRLAWMKSPGKISRILPLVDMVLAGNEYLAAYASRFNKNVKILPTTIDTERHKRSRDHNRSSGVCIGWTGSSTTIPHFESAMGALKRIRDKYNGKVSFKVIGDPAYYNEQLNVHGVPWSLSTEIEELQDIDIGIMPLPDDEWSKGKCALKGLQYMALEIPSVISPVGMNGQLVKDGVNGFLANNEEEWVEKLSRLIEDEALRSSIGKAARKTILEHYSVEVQKMNYLKYLNELLEIA